MANNSYGIGFKMKLAFYIMVKNEQAFASALSDMLQEFADYIYVVDHRSSDNTVKIITKNNPSANVYTLQSLGYPQAELSNFFARKIFTETDSDFIIFIDADEFLPFTSRDDLIRFLHDNRMYLAIYMHWNNLFPLGHSFNEGFSSVGISLNHRKLILSRAITNINDFKISQGNHTVTSLSYPLSIHDQDEYPLLHIPILSYEHLLLKVFKGVVALNNDYFNKKKKLGYHWYTMADQLLANEMDSAQLKEIAFEYGGSVQTIQEEKKLQFCFPYIKDRKFHGYSTKTIIIDILGDLVNQDRNIAQSILRRMDIVVTNDQGKIILKKEYGYLYILSSIVIHYVGSLLPETVKCLFRALKKWFGARTLKGT